MIVYESKKNREICVGELGENRRVIESKNAKNLHSINRLGNALNDQLLEAGISSDKRAQVDYLARNVRLHIVGVSLNFQARALLKLR